MERISSLGEDYDRLEHFLGSKDSPAAQRAQEHARGLKLDHIQIEHIDGNVLKLLLRLNQTRKVVEFGTLTGYSATNILAALPADGFLWTIEFDPKHAELARDTLRDEKGRVEVLVGDGPTVATTIEAQGPFDAVFVDANKAAYMDYLLWAEKNLRKGGMVILDNTLLHGEFFGDLKRFTPKMRDVMEKVWKHLNESPNWDLTIVPASDCFAVGIRK